MKVFILIFTLLIFIEAKPQNSGYVKLDDSTIENSELIQDLRRLGAEYTLELGIFQEKPALPNGEWVITETESVFQKIHGDITYYKYAVQIACESQPFLIRARYIVSFNNPNGDTLVTSSSYCKLKTPDYSGTPDLPIFVDNRLLTEGSDILNYLNAGIQFTVADAVRKGLLPRFQFAFKRVFSITISSPSSTSGYRFLVQIGSGEVINYRVFLLVSDDTIHPGSYITRYTIYPNA